MLHIHAAISDLCRDDECINLRNDLKECHTLCHVGVHLLAEHLSIKQLNLEEELVAQLSWVASVEFGYYFPHFLHECIGLRRSFNLTYSYSVD